MDLIRSESTGKIALCPHKGCNFCCTQFTAGNYIVLYPGELRHAQTLGQSVSHLNVIDDDYHGGARAVCRAKDPKTCDGGYKPLDCASYPFFPLVADPLEPIERLLKGVKCPLTNADIGSHADWVRVQWTRLARNVAAVREWLPKVRLVGYEPVNPKSS
jgi:hypothetical protein